MKDITEVWAAVVIAAVTIGLLLRVMMNGFDSHGLSYLAVFCGFCAVASLQMVSLYISEKIRDIPEPVKYW